MSNFYGAQLQDRLDHLNLTVYGASQIVGAEINDDTKTIHQRISRYLKCDPESFVKYTEIIEALGGRIEIIWKE